jgi:hypothetical protein
VQIDHGGFQLAVAEITLNITILGSFAAMDVEELAVTIDI